MPKNLWKERGYVPDSEDEDDEALDLSTTGVTHGEEAVLGHLEVRNGIEENGVATRARVEIDESSASGTELARCEVDVFDIGTVLGGDNGGNHGDVSAGLDHRIPEVQVVNTAVANESRPSSFIDSQRDYWRRNLRQRKEIQKHPYLLENQLYRQAFKARGLKPVNLLARSQEESQYTQNQDEEVQSPASSQSTQPNSRYKSSSPRIVKQHLPFANSDSDTPLSSPPESLDDDLPDLESLLRPTKRRKIRHEYSSTEKSVARRTKIAPNTPLVPTPTPAPSNGEIYDLTESPQLSFATVKKLRKPRFKVSPSLDNLFDKPRPQVDESNKARDEQTYEQADSDGDSVRILNDNSPVSNNEASAASSESDEVFKFGKRLRGILPMSWVKLDFQKQLQKGITQKPRVDRRRNELPEKGVAQKKATGLVNRGPLFLPDSDSEDASVIPNRRPNAFDLPTADVDGLREGPSNDPGSGMEYDPVDRMVSTTKKRPRQSKPASKKRQKSLYDMLDAPLRRQKQNFSTQGLPKSTGTHFRRNASNVANSSRKRPSPVKVGILDVQDEHEKTLKPSFIRIAMRQARQRRDFGRSSPRRKAIRLQTREDTAEVDEEFAKWMRNEITQRSLSKRIDKPKVSRNAERSSSVMMLSNRVQAVRDLSLRPLATQTKPPPKERRMLIKPKSFRTGQLETLESDHVKNSKRTAFESRLRQEEQEYRFRALGANGKDIRLERFLRASKPTTQTSSPKDDKIYYAHEHSSKVPRTRRKKETFRLDVETDRYRQPNLVPRDHLDTLTITDGHETNLGLTGLQSVYSVDWNITPLLHDPSVQFQASTFIGSGEFQKALYMNHRNFNESSGEHCIVIDGERVTWCEWNEQLSSELHNMFHKWLQKLENWPDILVEEEDSIDFVNSVSKALRAIIKSSSDILSFTDSVDRNLFAKFMHHHVAQLLECSRPFFEAIKPEKSKLLKSLLHLMTLQISLLAQVIAIQPQETESARYLMISASNLVLDTIFKHGKDFLSDVLSRNRSFVTREAGLSQDEVFAEAIVVLYNVFDFKDSSITFWGLFNSQFSSRVETSSDVRMMESIWQFAFYILPLTEINSTGRAVLGRRFHGVREEWNVFKLMLEKLFAAYLERPLSTSQNLNHYIRIVMKRCHLLISGWNWRHCDGIIGAIFDFFARNKLEPLNIETYHGSPTFLEEPGTVSLDLLPNDNSFHIFLKIVALGLRGMKNLYPAKRIINIIWRCIPNHNRQHRKENHLRELDLDALRNHHDLLCTLFRCSPDIKARTRLLSLVRGLVDHASSHQEVCRLSLKAWAQLIQFNLSQPDQSAFLDDFASWMKDIIEAALSQYRLARTEVESQYRAITVEERSGISNTLIKRTIKINQSQILETLERAISAIKGAVKSTGRQKDVANLLQDCGIDKVFGLQNESTACSDLVKHALEVYDVYLGLSDIQDEYVTATQSKNTESQDWDDLPVIEYVSLETVQRHIYSLLSGFFTNARTASDAFAVSLVNTWVRIISTKVRRGEADWNMFLEPVGEFSWERLMDHEQKDRFRVYFYATIVTLNDSSLGLQRVRILSVWLKSLVERESTLKFQHNLTSAILNGTTQDALLQNLPFYKQQSGGYCITMAQLKQRRLSLLSSILSNMQKTSREDAQSRMECASLLKDVMIAMKENYTLLQQRDIVTGVYVEFVQHIVQFLQQYANGIIKVDPFFTDVRTFPLPDSDPEYIVSRIKAQALGLNEPGGTIKLATFLLHISEKAAIEMKQDYLTHQLVAAMEDDIENDKNGSLVTAFLEIILPSYVEPVFDSLPLSIMSMPIMRAAAKLLDQMVYRAHVTSQVWRTTTLRTICIVLDSLCQAGHLIMNPASQPMISPFTLGLMVQVFYAAIPTVDLLRRLTGNVQFAEAQVSFIRAFTLYCAELFLDGQPAIQMTPVPALSSAQLRRNEKDDAQSLLVHHVITSWSCEAGRYFVKRGAHGREEVLLPEHDMDAITSTISAIEELHHFLIKMRILE